MQRFKAYASERYTATMGEHPHPAMSDNGKFIYRASGLHLRARHHESLAQAQEMRDISLTGGKNLARNFIKNAISIRRNNKVKFNRLPR